MMTHATDDSAERSEPTPIARAASLDLTPREADVYTLMLEGMRPKEITARLGINARNCRRYRMRVDAKIRKAGRALFLPNTPVSNGPESGPPGQQNDRTP